MLPSFRLAINILPYAIHGFLKNGVWGGRRRQSRLLPPQFPLCPRPGAGVRGWGKAGLSTLRKPWKATPGLPRLRNGISSPNQACYNGFTQTDVTFGGNMSGSGLFPMTEEHEMIRQAARDFAQREIAPIAAEYDETGEFPRETIRKMGEMGFMGIEVPEEYGGAGMDTLSYVLALEEICKADAAHGTIMSVNNSLFCHAVYNYGTEAQKNAFLRPVASGKAIGAYSLTQPMSGSDAATMRSRAVRQGDD